MYIPHSTLTNEITAVPLYCSDYWDGRLVCCRSDKRDSSREGIQWCWLYVCCSMWTLQSSRKMYAWTSVQLLGWMWVAEVWAALQHCGTAPWQLNILPKDWLWPAKLSYLSTVSKHLESITNIPCTQLLSVKWPCKVWCLHMSLDCTFLPLLHEMTK